ncbi:PREDICTED: uncharacterized protein LOC104818276 [Tarenaya hassleriana]|uniref:uncharacterized protein LOC104818276 n=1 Tax=Tarenaya hassleriana TaxID=28532 RepID=UPI00053C182B|nr:PREDICTED: uncharacterized protein LOC104818276 [Tarenaya hassleriana]
MAKRITKDEVIEKLKDDGDFDRLRLQIIRRLKDNEELRNNLISVVKQSTALNRPGAQSMRPRQLSDAIFEEVGSQMMSQLSENLWGIIRSEEGGVKNEIRETVQSVYDKLSNPGGIQEEEKAGPSTRVASRHQKQDGYNTRTPIKAEESTPDNDPKEPPGFSLMSSNHHKNGNQEPDLIQQAGEERAVEPCSSRGVDMQERNLTNEDSDEDPEVPPGFG